MMLYMTRRNHSDLKAEGHASQNVKNSHQLQERSCFVVFLSLSPLNVASLFQVDVLLVGCKIAINCNAACLLSKMEVIFE